MAWDSCQATSKASPHAILSRGSLFFSQFVGGWSIYLPTAGWQPGVVEYRLLPIRKSHDGLLAFSDLFADFKGDKRTGYRRDTETGGGTGFGNSPRPKPVS